VAMSSHCNQIFCRLDILPIGHLALPVIIALVSHQYAGIVPVAREVKMHTRDWEGPSVRVRTPDSLSSPNRR